MADKILVTGGLGYIGSHTVVELLTAGHQVVIVDNLSNSSINVLERIYKITSIRPVFYNIDIGNYVALESVFMNHQINAVIHFAGFKAVGESVYKPLEYYKNNVVGSIILFELMQKYKVANIIFSSSATVYGDSDIVPIPEDAKLQATNPYGHTKLMIEQILCDILIANNYGLQAAILRYFNPVGAHKSGLIGENPNGIPNNLMPYITQVAVGKIKQLSIFGNDYPTKDGTCIRDYIHVVDLALGHIMVLDYLQQKYLQQNSLHRGLTNEQRVNQEVTMPLVFNLGTGIGYSVLEVVQAFMLATNQQIAYRFVSRRAGDVAICYAKTDLITKLTNWQAKFGLNEMCYDAWQFQLQNPNGIDG